MEFLIYVVAIGTGLFGLGVGYRAFYTGSVGQNLGCLCYCVAAIIAIVLKSWIPLLIGWALTFVVRKVFGDPDQPLTPTQIQHYKKAAELREADAQFEMGFIYQHGKDISQDLYEAIKIL